MGSLGLATLETLLPELRTRHQVDFVVANGENSVDNGAGIDPVTAGRLLAAGVDVITTGNHAHDAPTRADLYGSEMPVIRPDNLAGSTVGKPSIMIERFGIKLGVANVIGAGDGHVPNRVLEDVDTAVRPLTRGADLILVDVHASWPAEKLAIAATLDGRVCAVVGTHTHVPTADARVLAGGTAYISDVGMTGARDSLIGFETDDMIQQIKPGDPPLPAPVTSGDGVLMAVLITAAVDGSALSIEPLRVPAPASDVRVADRNRDRINGARAAMRARTSPPAAAVFDCDGLLIDSAACWRQAYEQALAADRRSLDPNLLLKLNGASVSGAAIALNITRESLYEELRRAFQTGPLKAQQGARELLHRIDGEMPIAVATNAPAELVALALERVGLAAYLPTIVSADGMQGKPSPDVYLDACGRLGVQPTDAVAFEDSPIGAAAAQAAGLTLVYVPTGAPALVTPDLIVHRLDDPRVLAVLGCHGFTGARESYATSPHTPR